MDQEVISDEKWLEIVYKARRNIWRQDLKALAVFEFIGFLAVYVGFSLGTLIGWVTLAIVVAATLYFLPGLIRLIKNRPRREDYGLK